MKKYITFMSVVIICAVGVFTVKMITKPAEADQRLPPGPTLPADLCGWAWSSNIGWINFNSDISNCPSASSQQAPPAAFLFKQAYAQTGGNAYRVRIDADGTLDGYAWSSNIGWIQFGKPTFLNSSAIDLSGFPAPANDPYNGFNNANVNMTSGRVTGWVRACSGTINANDSSKPGDCSSMNSRTDGWDGWIQLSGTYHTPGDSSGNSGVNMDPTTYKFNGYAWGGPVVGWVNFNPSTSLGVPGVSCPGCVPGSTPPVSMLSCSLSNTSLPNNGSYEVLVTASASGGWGHDYMYSWRRIGNVNGTMYSAFFPGTTQTVWFPQTPPDTYSVWIAAIDSSSIVASGFKLCGQVTVAAGNPQPSGTLNLFIAKNSTNINPSDDLATNQKYVHDNTTGHLPLKINKGKQFELAWNDTMTPKFANGNGYKCTTDIIKFSNSTSVASLWPGFGSNYDPANNSNTKDIPGFTTSDSDIAPDLYDFKISCQMFSDGTKTSDSPITASAYLRIVNASEGEI